MPATLFALFGFCDHVIWKEKLQDEDPFLYIYLLWAFIISEMLVHRFHEIKYPQK